VSFRVEFDPAAEAEISSALHWYASRSKRAAAGFVREVDRAVTLIASGPELWPEYDSNTRRYSLRKYPYSIIYRQTADIVQIVAVAHHRRKPGYWR
jgi:plasmid stabilization system protein ParE